MPYRQDIENLISQIKPDIWRDKTICCLLYDIFPWHGYSSISLQTRQCNSLEIASWKYFEAAKSNGEILKSEFSKYNKNESKLQYHFMLCSAAKALIEINFLPYGIQRTTQEFHLYHPFKLQVLDPDGTFSFNYCELVLAQKIEAPKHA